MRKLVAIGATLALLSFAGTAFSHELILKPMKMSAAEKETVALEVHSAHAFIVAEEAEDISAMKAGVFSGGKVLPIQLERNEAELRIDSKFVVPHAGAVLVVCEKLPLPYGRTNEGGKLGTRKELEARGLKVASVNKYDKFAKAIVNAAPGDTNFAEIAGQELEIVPVTNPAEVKPGDFMTFKALFKGRPVSGPVWATYDGFSPDENTYAYYTEGGASDGTFRVKITAPGLWIVRTTRTDEGKDGEYDSRILRSVLTFEVK